MAGQSFEASHERRDVPQHGADRTAHAARHEATNGLMHGGTDHKNLSKLPSNKHSELHHVHIDGAGKPADHKPADHKPADHKPADHKPADHKPAKSPEKQLSEHMVSDLQNKNNQGELSPETTKELSDLSRKAYAKDGMAGVDKLGDKINNELRNTQDENQVPGWKKRFEFGNSTGTWRDFSLNNGSMKNTAGVELAK
jgi:hypothetical protein